MSYKKSTHSDARARREVHFVEIDLGEPDLARGTKRIVGCAALDGAAREDPRLAGLTEPRVAHGLRCEKHGSRSAWRGECVLVLADGGSVFPRRKVGLPPGIKHLDNIAVALAAKREGLGKERADGTCKRHVADLTRAQSQAKRRVREQRQLGIVRRRPGGVS
jgi:hypothetical protein